MPRLVKSSSPRTALSSLQSFRAAAVAGAFFASTGCTTVTQVNHPLEAADGSIARTGFGRSSTIAVAENALASSVFASTRVGQAASVVPGARGDRLFRISPDGAFLEYCRLIDEAPRDCTIVTLPTASANPTIVEPGNLGEGSYFGATSSSYGSWAFASGATRASGFLPATPHFGIWVFTSPPLTVPTLFGGLVTLGSGVAFCNVDEDDKPTCFDAKLSMSRALSVHVLRGPASDEAPSAALGKPVHVLWGQPVGKGVAVRCEADDESGSVNCVNATEVLSR